METEIKQSKGKEERIRHWTDREVKEAHHMNGKTWRSNKDKLLVIPISDAYRSNYDDIFRKN